MFFTKTLRWLARRHLALCFYASIGSSVTAINCAVAQTATQPAAASDAIAEVVVTSTRQDMQGIASSASEGIVTAKQLRTRPLLRAGDIMEAVPGLIATQHSGEGKANQYFLRGFNLDHGTDLATFVDGVPINFSTHAHGQGYTDLYFLIPELVETVRFRKGPYYAQEGDFATAGSVRMQTINRINKPTAVLEAGSFGYSRVLGIGSTALAGGHWLFAAERVADDGPWAVKQHLRKLNLSTKFSSGDAANGFSIGASHYEASWTATDQVPQRAIDSGLIGRFGSLDPTAGGKTKRDAINANWASTANGAQTRVSAYALRYQFDLFSNFSYFTQGCDAAPLPASCDGSAPLDQFQQADKRKAFGLSASHREPFHLAGYDLGLSVGTDLRRDNISQIGLFDTTARMQTNTVRNDSARVDALGFWAELDTQINAQLRATTGLRFDQRLVDVQSSIAANSGKRSASIISPKASLIYTASPRLDLYANWGQGFHSNDARGTVIQVDPRNPAQAVNAATPLVKATGFELGARQKIASDLSTTIALWDLKLDSELLFVGDAGTTEPSRPSSRRGIELTANWKPSSAWELDADASFTRSRFIGGTPTGNFVPGAMKRVISIGATYQNGPWTMGARIRHFGPRPLLEDNSIQGASSTITNLKASYRLTKNIEASAELFNLFNRKANDIEYAYASRLPGEAAFAGAANTLHVHPSLPRTLRLGLKVLF